MDKFWCLCSLFYLIIVTFAGEPEDGDPKVYTKESFADELDDGPHFVLFYAPWCGHCKNVLPTWQELEAKYGEEYHEEVKITKVDCVKNAEVCAEYGIRGYPTMKFFFDAVAESVTFQGGRDLATFVEFIKKQLASDNQEPETPDAIVKTGLYELTDQNFDAHIEQGHHFIKFYAPWCGHCQHLAPTWAELATFYAENQDVKIGKVDCTQNQATCQKFGIRAYPTLLWFSHGEKREKYSGSRTTSDFRTYVKTMHEKFIESSTRSDERIPKVEVKAEYVKVLSEANFDDTISSGTTFVKFYVDWCGHCKALAPIYKDLGKDFHLSGSSITIAEVNCDNSGTLCQKNMVNVYPTLILYQNGEKRPEYVGKRTVTDFTEYLAKNIPRDEL